MKISSTHCDGELEGCGRLVSISMVTGELRGFPKPACPVRSFPSRTDLKGLELQTTSRSHISYLMHYYQIPELYLIILETPSP